jgi:hypothetical protein
LELALWKVLQTSRFCRLLHAARRKVTLTTIQEKLDEAEFCESWERGMKLPVDEAVALSLGEVEADT